jgi:hypothetical protein
MLELDHISFSLRANAISRDLVGLEYWITFDFLNSQGSSTIIYSSTKLSSLSGFPLLFLFLYVPSPPRLPFLLS